MKVIAFTSIFQIFFQTSAVLAIGEYTCSLDVPQFSVTSASRPIKRKLKYLMDYRYIVAIIQRLAFTFLVHQCEGMQEEGKPVSSLCLSVERKIKMTK